MLLITTSEISHIRNKKLTSWSKVNKFSFTKSQVKLISFTANSKFSTMTSDIKLNKHLLTPEKSVMYLSIMISKKLSFNKETEFL